MLICSNLISAHRQTHFGALDWRTDAVLSDSGAVAVALVSIAAAGTSYPHISRLPYAPFSGFRRWSMRGEPPLHPLPGETQVKEWIAAHNEVSVLFVVRPRNQQSERLAIG